MAAESPDWIEAKTSRLLTAARRSGFFANVIADAKLFAAEGYVWDVALMLSLRYWAADPVTGRVPGVA